MKILCFILSLYVLLLVTSPCCSDENCDDDMKKEYVDNHSQDHEDNDNDTCSPFFTCGTCSGFVFTRMEVDFKEVAFVKHIIACVYKSQFVSDFFSKIWQPPKISKFITFF